MPIFTAKISHPKERYHLLSFLRILPERHYENPSIEDFYYFHELMHMVQWKPDPLCTFDQFKERLTLNELYASVFSEVFIYFFIPQIVGKTFDPLWAHHFLPEAFKAKSEQIYEIHGIFATRKDLDEGWVEFSEAHPNFILQPTPHFWPHAFAQVFTARLRLRLMKESTDPASQTIINYQKMHQPWLVRWEPYAHDIDQYLYLFTRNPSNSAHFLAFIEKHQDPKTLVPFAKVLFTNSL